MIAAHRIVCISVETKEGDQRLESLKAHFNEMNTPPPMTVYRVKRDDQNPVRGCATSHKAVNKEAATLMKESRIITTVVECDVRIKSEKLLFDWQSIVLPFCVQSGEVDLLLGGASSFRPMLHENERYACVLPIPNSPYNIVRAGHASGFFCYACLTPAAFEAFDKISTYGHIDIGILSNTKLKIWAVSPTVAQVGNGFSIIRNNFAAHQSTVDSTEKIIARQVEFAAEIKKKQMADAASEKK